MVSSKRKISCLGWLGIAVLAVAGLVFLTAITWNLFIRNWHLTWGATPAEAAAVLPGDELISNPVGDQTTRAITIKATPEQIWPWLVQMGADKGGLYSYTWLEGMIRCPQTNADRIHPEWQQLNPEDPFRMCPEGSGPPPYFVAKVIPGQALVVGHHPLSDAEKASGMTWTDSWAFVIQPLDAQTTRLIVRSRNGIDAPWRHWIEFGYFIMERGLIHGIRERAQSIAN